MKRRKRWLLASLFSLLSVVTTFALICWLPRTAINQETYDRIEIGMTLAEVEAILGGPARNEATGPIEVDDDVDMPTFLPALIITRMRHACWSSNRIQTYVAFDHEHRVMNKACLRMHRVPESPVDMFRRWFR